jgi:hypothetical protein
LSVPHEEDKWRIRVYERDQVSNRVTLKAFGKFKNNARTPFGKFKEITLKALAGNKAESKFKGITLKALANSSPGFALKPWVQKTRIRFFATLKELRLLCAWRTKTQPFQGCVFYEITSLIPGLPKRNLGWN